MSENNVVDIRSRFRPVADSVVVPEHTVMVHALDPPTRPLPDADDMAAVASLVDDLGFAENDGEKVAALKAMSRWLARWQF